MLLEVNRLRNLIIGRPPADLAEQALFERLPIRKIAILVEPSSIDLWHNAIQLEQVTILPYDDTQMYGLPANIRVALAEMEAEPHNSAYVTFDVSELPDAVTTRIGTIQVGGTIGEVLPDLYLGSFPGGLVNATNAKSLLELGHSGEVLSNLGDGVVGADGGHILFQRNYLSFLDHSDDRAGLTGVYVYVLGRYFASGDARYHKHQYTKRILGLKTLKQSSEIIERALGGALNLIVGRQNVDIITRVPPKPQNEHDHLAWILDRASRRADARFAIAPTLLSRINLDLLSCPEGYDSQHKAGGSRNRARNVAGAFEVARDLDGEDVLLVDDILTSGSTVAECARVLLQAGAGTVSILVLAKNQNVIKVFPLDPECANLLCEGTATPRINSTTGAMFWGCSLHHETNCRSSYQWGAGLQASNKMNTRDDLPSDDIAF